jgi:hypothetical protein
MTDAESIAQLAKAGSDLTQLHQIDFVLRFPTQKAGLKAELALQGFAFQTKLQPGKAAAEWIIHAIKIMYPLESDLSGLRDKLEVIAAEGKGSYDGWTAKVFVRKAAG